MNDIGSTASQPADSEVPPASAGVISQDGSGGVRLVPDLPPGRCTRKALPYADEIRRLYETGYTLEAIRRALAAAGVSVSRSTVHREVTRTARQPPASSSAVSSRPLEQVPQPAMVEITAPPQGGEVPVSAGPLASPGKPEESSFANGPSGEDVAKAFMSTQITNPFMRKKEHP